MAIRYSGDVEVRLGWDPRRKEYRGTVTDPFTRKPWRGVWRPVRFFGEGTRTEPEAYDKAAHELIKQADAWMRSSYGRSLQSEKKYGRFILRRIFQAPCPLGTISQRKSG